MRLGQARVGDEDGILGQVVMRVEMCDDHISVARRSVATGEIAEVAAGCCRGIEEMLMGESEVAQLREGEDLEIIAVIVGDAESSG